MIRTNEGLLSWVEGRDEEMKMNTRLLIKVFENLCCVVVIVVVVVIKRVQCDQQY